MPHVNISSVGVTEAPRQASVARDSPIGVYPSPATKDHFDDDHFRSRRRIFIGPMPENTAARLRAASSGDNSAATLTGEFTNEDFARDNMADDDASSSESEHHEDHSESGSASDRCSGTASSRARKISRKRLLRAFVSRGGDRKHFSEREIWKKWHAGGWSRVPLPADASARRWVGASFEVGMDVLGDMGSSTVSQPQNGRRDGMNHGSQSPVAHSVTGFHTGNGPVSPPPPSRTTTMETFMTARSRRSSNSDEEASVFDTRSKGKLKSSDCVFGETLSNTSKVSLPQSRLGEPSSQTSDATQRVDSPVSSSPLLRNSSKTRKPRPHSTIGIPNVLSGQPKPGPSNASESHLPALLSSPQIHSLEPKENGLRSALRRNFGTLKGGSIKQRSVVFAESPKPLSDTALDPFSKLHRSTSLSVPSALPIIAQAPSENPASPAEVLGRESEPTDTTSAGAAVALQAQQTRIPEDGIVLRDRMLVRAAYNRSSGLPKPYDEAEARRHPDTQEMQWKEMLVVWRRSNDREDRVELYQDYATPGKERILGHKDLAFVVPLTEGVTSVSLYSHVDSTFCLTCPPTPVRTGTPSKRARFHRAPIGTNIFVCKVKSRTRALNWIWNLWRYLGGKLPDTIDIHCPALGTRVRVDIPDLDHGASDSWKRFTRSYLIEACGRSLQGLPDWDSMMESPALRGSRLELAWRKESKLDWVWQETDDEGKEIDWQVLFGLALRQPSLPSQLEIRLGLHAPTHVALSDGSSLGKTKLVPLRTPIYMLTCSFADEPPAVEGYLHRIKPKTLTRTNVYLTSHDGYLFTLRYADAEPPAPPVLVQQTLDDTGRQIVRQRELWRARCMILNADGYIDLRSILAVRRAVEPTPPTGTIDIGVARSTKRLPNDTHEHDDFDDGWVDQADASDGEDEGGDEYLSRNEDKARLKMKRSFELIMRSGRVIRFEAYSRNICLEWIANLRNLIKYWTRRHRVDARDEMELVFATQGRVRFTIPKLGREEAPEGWVPDGASPYLAKFWNWCVLEGCRAIVRAGRLYTKKGIRKQFKHHFHVLTGGHLVLFHITPNVTSYHRHSRTVNLADAYVYSGQIAMRSLPRAAGVDSRQKIPRRYQDGLESDDRYFSLIIADFFDSRASSEEDTTFIIWYRPHNTHIPLDPLLSSESTVKDEPTIAPLGGKHKLIICKARSRLERDVWCWVLNTEIERLSRMLLTREKHMRRQGALVSE
ncbi:Pleckstrin homology domain, partial [Rhizoctonia solani]